MLWSVMGNCVKVRTEKLVLVLSRTNLNFFELFNEYGPALLVYVDYCSSPYCDQNRKSILIALRSKLVAL